MLSLLQPLGFGLAKLSEHDTFGEGRTEFARDSTGGKAVLMKGFDFPEPVLRPVHHWFARNYLTYLRTLAFLNAFRNSRVHF